MKQNNELFMSMAATKLQNKEAKPTIITLKGLISKKLIYTSPVTPITIFRHTSFCVIFPLENTCQY